MDARNASSRNLDLTSSPSNAHHLYSCTQLHIHTFPFVCPNSRRPSHQQSISHNHRQNGHRRHPSLGLGTIDTSRDPRSPSIDTSMGCRKNSSGTATIPHRVDRKSHVQITETGASVSPVSFGQQEEHTVNRGSQKEQRIYERLWNCCSTTR